MPLLSDGVALMFEDWGPFDEAQARRFLKRRLAVRKTQSVHLHFTILDHGRQVVGMCDLRLPVPGKNGWASLGYAILPVHGGKGFATEATTVMIESARSLPRVGGVRAITDSKNIASRRVLEKCGLTPTGMTAEIVPVKGRFRDMLRYELAF